MELSSAAEDVADRVVQHLSLAGRDASWLCCATGISIAVLDRQLSGDLPFTLNEVDRIAEALNTSPATLLTAP